MILRVGVSPLKVGLGTAASASIVLNTTSPFDLTTTAGPGLGTAQYALARKDKIGLVMSWSTMIVQIDIESHEASTGSNDIHVVAGRNECGPPR